MDDITIDMRGDIENVLESSFAEACRLHDRAIERSISAFEAVTPGTRRDVLETEALRASNIADAVKFIIKARWPEPARAWFGE